jgi:hypothetical protein
MHQEKSGNPVPRHSGISRKEGRGFKSAPGCEKLLSLNRNCNLLFEIYMHCYSGFSSYDFSEGMC